MQATAVPGARCTDTFHTSCAAVIASEILTCEEDFCDSPPTTDAPCDLAGHCDKTCGFCVKGGDTAGGGNHRRRTQLAVSSCDFSTFDDNIQEVETACCDSDQCADGVPTECDAKCAVVFDDFYDRCQRLLSSTVSLAIVRSALSMTSPLMKLLRSNALTHLGRSQMSSYERLYSTCTESLPAEPLLSLLASCSAAAGAQPCGPTNFQTVPCSATLQHDCCCEDGAQEPSAEPTAAEACPSGAEPCGTNPFGTNTPCSSTVQSDCCCEMARRPDCQTQACRLGDTFTPRHDSISTVGCCCDTVSSPPPSPAMKPGLETVSVCRH